MPLDPVRVEETRAWLARAHQDLRAGAHDLTAVPPLLEDVLFHAQQGAEKALRAFLLWHDIPFRKTHSLVELGQQVLPTTPSLEALVRRAAPLTEGAWRYRYPGDWGAPSREEAEAALAVAGEVYAAILERLPPEVRP